MPHFRDSRNSSFYVPSPQSAAWEIREMCTNYSTKVIPVNKMAKFEKSIFLRSPELEYEDFRKKPEKMEQETYERKIPKKIIKNPLEYSPVTGLKLDCPPNYRATTLNPVKYGPIEPWEPQPQFWYDAKTAYKGPTWPVGSPDDYGFESLEPPPREAADLLKAMEIERPERYIPGEIFKNKAPKDPIEDLSGTGGCISGWVPKCKDIFNSKFDPSTLPRQPLFADYVKDKENVFKDKLTKVDLSIYKRTDNYEDLIKKYTFKSGSSERNGITAMNVQESEENYEEVTKDFRNRCHNAGENRVWRNENRCSCCGCKNV